MGRGVEGGTVSIAVERAKTPDERARDREAVLAFWLGKAIQRVDEAYVGRRMPPAVVTDLVSAQHILKRMEAGE
jgi:hypothetical protein